MDINTLTKLECLVSSFDITLDGRSLWGKHPPLLPPPFPSNCLLLDSS